MEKKKIVITGASGMFGTHLCRALSRSHNVIGILHRHSGYALPGVQVETADIAKSDEIRKIIQDLAPDIVIHTASYTDVDGCELNPEKAFTVNSEGTKNVTLACRECEAKLVYISTDYVFDGEKSSPYTEVDSPNPINVYGKSKCSGEAYVTALLSKWYIVRTAGLFGRGGKNFVDTILKLAQERDELRVVADQVGCPTFCENLADVLRRLILTGDYGIYHMTNNGYCSWYEFASEILKIMNHDSVRLTPITSEELNRPANRPRYSVLAKTRMEEVLGIKMPHWKVGLRCYLTSNKE